MVHLAWQGPAHVRLLGIHELVGNSCSAGVPLAFEASMAIQRIEDDLRPLGGAVVLGLC